MKNVRYIAVNDGVDTANKNNDIAALKNVMNEFYSRDNSRKIRSSIRARAKTGLYHTNRKRNSYRRLGTAAFAVSEGIPQSYIHKFSHKRQAQYLPCRD